MLNRPYGNDALGFGNFPGQFGMVFLSKFPIDTDNIRTFQNFLWQDMPDALLPDDPNTPEPNDWYSAEELAILPLSSKSHWDIPVEVDGEIIHVLASHPTPPTFDGEEDRNGRRNHDEIRFWADYVTPGEGDYITDDNATTGGIEPGLAFVIMGDQNADPFDGDSTDDAILQLIDNENIQGSATDVNITPDSEGGIAAAESQGGANEDHEGNPAFDTEDFGDENPGNLRVDYVLPSNNLNIDEAEVFWPLPETEEAELVEASDHRLVYTDLTFAEDTAFTLEILHAADQEAGIPAVNDAVNFSAVLNALEADPEFENTVKLTSGDLFISGPFFNTSRNIYGEPGIADILINNALGFQAAAIGNHEFDLGPDAFNTLIRPDAEITGPGIGEEGYLGTAFPYLSTNLDFSGEEDLAELVVDPADAPQPNTISDSVVIEVNGESIGVVGATTPRLRAIANIGDIVVTPPDADDIAALAATIQPSVDELVSQGIDKIILLAHMQQISVEEELAELLTGVDIIMAGGSNTLLANEDDPLRDGDEIERPYPIEKTSASDEPVFVINTEGNYQYVGRLIADFDNNGIITEIGEKSGTYATDIAGVNRLYEQEITTQEDVEPLADQTVVEVTSAIGDIVEERDSNVFGLTEVFLNGT
ncbi:MAG: endonuclease/exonuclease/phosphatase family protein, partial [Cyanobacteriota bacterium]|nr:endonuclease/exonuclease/phosphatase family protein [Cyanobacteriota bacterium]